MKTKVFYKVKLKAGKENVPVRLAKILLKDESPLIKYLSENRALIWSYWPSTETLVAKADEKHLMIGKMMYPDMFPNRGRMGFMELYISRLINKKLKKLRVWK